MECGFAGIGRQSQLAFGRVPFSTGHRQDRNKIKHRMFCHITQNWRGRRLVSCAAIVELIGSTKTERGLRLRAEGDKDEYPTKETVAADQLAKVRLRRAVFHGEMELCYPAALRIA